MEALYVHLAMLLVSAAVGLAGLWTFRNYLIIEVGALAFIIDFVYEYVGTLKGWWSYAEAGIMIGNLPLTVPLIYFFLGMAAASYILWRQSFKSLKKRRHH